MTAHEALTAARIRVPDLILQGRDPGMAMIHGELGPDHVLVDRANNPATIDIEGAMYLDVEWEHMFLELRFGDDYRYLVADDLDTDRLRVTAWRCTCL